MGESLFAEEAWSAGDSAFCREWIWAKDSRPRVDLSPTCGVIPHLRLRFPVGYGLSGRLSIASFNSNSKNSRKFRFWGRY